MPDPALPEGTGLCGSCVNARRTGNRSGSGFILCLLSASDPFYPRYPRLPVLTCGGHRPAPEAPPATG